MSFSLELCGCASSAPADADGNIAWVEDTTGNWHGACLKDLVPKEGEQVELCFAWTSAEDSHMLVGAVREDVIGEALDKAADQRDGLVYRGQNNFLSKHGGGDGIPKGNFAANFETPAILHVVLDYTYRLTEPPLGRVSVAVLKSKNGLTDPRKSEAEDFDFDGSPSQDEQDWSLRAAEETEHELLADDLQPGYQIFIGLHQSRARLIYAGISGGAAFIKAARGWILKVRG
jgi:hypothetical protein